MLVASVLNMAKDYNIDTSALISVLQEPAAQESVEPAKQLSESVESAAKIHMAVQGKLAQQLHDFVMAAVGRAGGRYVFSQICCQA